MSITEFERKLVSLIRKEPFQPFDIEMLDGQRITVDRADAVGWNEGSAAFIAADGSLHFFDNNKVSQFGSLNGAAAS